MKKTLLTGCALVVATTLLAQSTSTLSEVLNLLPSTKTINVASNGIDVFEKTDITPSGDYTLEVKSTITSSVNRGLDAEVRDAAGQGFRVSCSPTAIIDFANILSAGSSITPNDNTSLTTMRYVMYNNTLNIYKNDAVTPINAAPIAKTSVVRNLVDDAGFENGGWGNWIATGGSVGTATLKEPAEIVQYESTLTTPTVIAGSGKALFFDIQSGTNGAGWYYTVPVTAGVYEYKVKSLPYKAGGSTSTINNTLVRIRAGVGVAGTSLSSVYLNGHSGNGAWVSTTLRFVVPVGETSVSFIIEKSNNNKIYFDDFELRRIGESFTDLGTDNEASITGIYNNLNLLKATTSFEGIATDASPGGLWESNKAMGGATSARIQAPAITTNLKDGTNAFMMRFEQSYTWFSYPVTLQPNKVYKLSYLQAGNSASMPSYYVAVCNAKDGATASTYYLKSSTTPNATAMVGSIVTQYFTTPATLPSEPIYLSFYKNGTNAPVFHVDKLVLQEATGVELQGLIVGKNFYNGAANMEITSIKYTTGAYTPFDFSSKLDEKKSEQFIGYANGQLIVRNINARELCVFDVTGKKLITSALQNSNTSFSVQLPQGIYVVKAGEVSRKLIVR